MCEIFTLSGRYMFAKLLGPCFYGLPSLPFFVQVHISLFNTTAHLIYLFSNLVDPLVELVRRWHDHHMYIIRISARSASCRSDSSSKCWSSSRRPTGNKCRETQSLRNSQSESSTTSSSWKTRTLLTFGQRLPVSQK